MSFLFFIQIVSGLIFIAAELLKATLITIEGLLESQCYGFFKRLIPAVLWVSFTHYQSEIGSVATHQ